MSVRTSLKRTVGLLRDTPSLWAIALAYALIATPIAVVGNLGNPLLVIGSFLGLFLVGGFVFPFFVGGAIGLASEGLDGGGGFDAFLDAGKDNYLYLLGFTWVAGLVEFAWAFVVGIVAYFVALVVGLALVFGVLAGGGSTASMAIVAVLGAVLGIGFALAFYLVGGIPILLVQFTPGAYVVENRDPIDGVKRSLGLIRDNLVSVLGFDVTVFLINLVVSVVPWALVVAGYFLIGPDAVVSTPSFSPDPAAGPAAGGPGTSGQAGGGFNFTLLGAALYGLGMLIVTPIQSAFLVAYYTSFFHEIAGEGDGIEGGDVAPDAGEWQSTDDATA